MDQRAFADATRTIDQVDKTWVLERLNSFLELAWIHLGLFIANLWKDVNIFGRICGLSGFGKMEKWEKEIKNGPR